MALSLVSYGDSGSDSELEDGPSTISTSGKTQQDMRKLLSVLPPPKVKSGPSKQKQPVRIGLPTLNKTNDSDSDDDLPVVKKPKQGAGSGLKALLPEPKGAVRGFGSSKKPPPSMSSMVPYTLTKRYQDSRKQTKSKETSLKKRKSIKHGDEDSDSDNDEPVSFFSLDNNIPSPKPDVPIPKTNEHPSTLGIPNPAMNPTEQHNIPESNTHSNVPVSDHHTSDSGYGHQYQQDQHISSQSYPYPQDYYSNPIATQHQGWSSTNEQYAYTHDSSLHGSTNRYPEVGQNASVQQATVDTSQAVTGTGPGLSIDEEQLRRLAGGKKGRKRDEGLNNILDIREDDVKEGIKDYQKYHSEDSVNKLYQVDSSKMKAPTSQQKRKHQLSYLAHQAKANELELTRHWAHSASTKRETQMKYGF